MPHPAFAAHFIDPIYDDPALETAPFGDDDGADLLSDRAVTSSALTRPLRALWAWAPTGSMP